MATLLTLAGCGPKMKVLDPQGPGSRHQYLLSSPLILTGDVRAIETAGWIHKDRHGDVQLFRLKVGVEHVLQGQAITGTINIYCLLNRGNWTGLEPLYFLRGDSYIFYVRKEADEWRTACDVFAYCVDHILTGEHSKFKKNPNQPVADDILRILLTRGDRTSDGAMVDALSGGPQPYYEYGFEWRYDRKETYLNLLQETAQTETPPVRAEACELLKGLGKPCKPCEVTQ